MLPSMSSRIEIQKEIEQLPQSEVVALHAWLTVKAASSRPPQEEAVWQNPHTTPEEFAAWLRVSVGVAKPGVTTDSVMALTRGED